MTFLAFLQVATAILNLLPIPGIDGYGVIEPFLSANMRHTGNRMKPYGIILLFLLMLLPPVQIAFRETCDFVLNLAGAPLLGDMYGYSLFKFWRHF